MNVNPKHCPFCGNSTITANAGAVSCYQCSAKIELQNCNTHYALERWNTRAVESELAALKEEFAAFKLATAETAQAYIERIDSLKEENERLKKKADDLCYVLDEDTAIIANLRKERDDAKECEVHYYRKARAAEARVAELEELNTELRADVAKLKERDVDAIANKICGQLPDGYVIRLYMENGAGYVELNTPNNENDRNDFECSIYSQIVCAFEVAEELFKEPANEG